MDKLCKDCKHFAPNGDGGNCIAPQQFPIAPDYVNGGTRRSTTPFRYFRAQANREGRDAGDCGPEARWFEPKVAA